jgi:hypothetical protein
LCSLYNNTFSLVKEHFETLQVPFLEYHSVNKTIKLMTPWIGSTVLIHILFLVNFVGGKEFLLDAFCYFLICDSHNLIFCTHHAFSHHLEI